MTIKTGTRWGQQPAKGKINYQAKYVYLREGCKGNMREAARRLTTLVGYRVPESTLRSYLNGERLAPAEIKLGVANILNADVADCWTPEVLATTYVGRGSFNRPDGT